MIRKIRFGVQTPLQNMEEVRDRIRQFVEVGVTHFILIASAPDGLDWIRGFAEEVIPSFRG